MTSVAVVGGGAAGIGAAYSLISAGHEVTIYEAESHLGGHCFGVPIKLPNNKIVHLDAGGSDFNHENFVNVVALLDELKLEYYPVVQNASFMATDRTPLWYTRDGQPIYCREPLDRQGFEDEIARFVTTCHEVLEDSFYKDWTTEKYLDSRGYSQDFRRYYFYPRASGCFPMPDSAPESFRIRVLIAFYNLHGIIGGKPAPRMVLKGGMFRYCYRFAKWFQERGGKLLCDTTTIGVSRRGAGIRVRAQDKFKQNLTHEYDHVVIATNSNQVIPLLEDSTKEEVRIFNSFQWQRARLVVHRDEQLMPSIPEAWQSYNYVVGEAGEIETRPTITFYPYSLASLEELPDVFVTMNPYREPAKDKIIYSKFFVHPAAGTVNDMACESLSRIQGYRNTWYAGAYMREPFVHEQAYSSGFDLGRYLADFLEEPNSTNRIQMLSFNDFLGQVPLFDGLEPIVLSDLNLSARPFDCAAEEELFRQGDESTGMYLVRTGSVRVELRIPGDETLQISRVGEYGIVGEMSLMDEGVRSATAIAETETNGYFISRQSFDMLRTDLRPAGILVANCLAKEVSRRCRLLIEGITNEGSKQTGHVDVLDLARTFKNNDAQLCAIAMMRMFTIFKDFTDAEIQELVSGSEKLVVPSGGVLFRQQDVPDAMYIVIRGALRLGHDTSGQVLQFNVAGPGAMAGIIEVTEGRTRVADLTAREDSVLLRITANHYREILGGGSAMTFKFISNLNVQLVQHLRLINTMAARIAAFGQFS